jgi:ComF family protein
LIKPHERCKRCFASLGECTLCRQKGYPFTSLAAALEYEGPAVSLVQHFKYHNKPYLAKDAAALLVLQYLKLNWLPPNLIISVPQPITRSFLRGYSPSLLLAKEVGKFLDCPVEEPLRRLSGDLPQAVLNKEQRERLLESNFEWKKQMSLNEKVVLLIDDVRTTGTTLLHSGNLLREGFPRALYSMTLCM